jgi:2-C-methyl-D-erythritol 4-phosphate cytidylyltransferase/2-C-methyl-D-erythritol 2,4-cyclodiphosphate synthase
MGAGEPKQFLLLRGKPMLAWSVDAFLAHGGIEHVVVVAAPDQVGRVQAMFSGRAGLSVVVGGADRTASVRAGLEALAEHAPDRVLIHDAARPGVSGAVIDELLAALDATDAACPALPMIDAIKERGPVGELRTVPRNGLWRVQTPQAFRFALALAAYRNGETTQVDDLALIEQSGARVTLTPGRAELMKVTLPEDIGVMERLLAETPMGSEKTRVGQGFDVHAFEPGDAVILCGVPIAHNARLKGHSDADAAWHALTDAILGALALGDIGDHFPPSDPQWKGVASIVFLEHAVKLASERGYRIANADITIICEAPKISPHREAMRARTAEAMGVPLDQVSVKATTTEKLGFTGRKEGIAVQAVVMLAG